MDLHRSIALPFQRIPAVRFHMVSSDQGEEGNDLPMYVSAPVNETFVERLTPIYEAMKSGIEKGCTKARQLLNKISKMQKQSP